MVAQQGDAYRCRHIQPQTIQCRRLTQRLRDAFTHRVRVRTARHASKDGELVAAETGDNPAISVDCGQPLRHRDKELVTDLMSQGIVDVLEPVQVEHQQRELPVRCIGTRARSHGREFVEASIQSGSVGQARQRVQPHRAVTLVREPGHALDREQRHKHQWHEKCVDMGRHR